jgi:hypothetical protein
MSNIASRIWTAVARGFGMEQPEPAVAAKPEDSSSRIRRRNIDPRGTVTSSYVPPAKNPAPAEDRSRRPSRLSYQQELFITCLKSWLRHEDISQPPLLTLSLREFLRQPKSRNARDQLLAQLDHQGLSPQALDALRRSCRTIFSMRSSIPLEPAMAGIEAAPVYYEVRSTSPAQMNIRPIADAEPGTMDLGEYRAEEIRLVVADAMKSPIVIVTPHCGWHHEPGVLASALHDAARAKGLAFHHTHLEGNLRDVLTRDFGTNSAMLVLEDFLWEPTPPSAELMQYLAKSFFARPRGQNGTPLERKLVLVLQSTWLKPEWLADAWNTAIASLLQHPDTVLPGMGSVPIAGLPLKGMNLLQTWHLVGDFNLSFIRNVARSGVPLLPLALLQLRERVHRERERALRRDLIAAFGRTFMDHDEPIDPNRLHSHLIVPKNGDWGAYLKRLKELSLCHPISFQPGTEYIAMRAMTLGDGADDTCRISTPIPPEHEGGEVVPVGQEHPVAEASVTPAVSEEITQPSPAAHIEDAGASEELAAGGFEDTLEGMPPPPGHLLPMEACAAASIAASVNAAADLSLLSETLAYRFVGR